MADCRKARRAVPGYAVADADCNDDDSPMTLPVPHQPVAVPMAPRCLSLDLEVGVRDGRIHSFAAVLGDTQSAFVFRKGDLADALARLDEFAATSSFLLGHNLIDFDLPHLAAASPRLALLCLPAVDTLRLNPLAFPRNPYHHLVKHYQDGRLQSGALNDPELDARLALAVFRDQLLAFQAMQSEAPDLLTAWHWLTVPDGVASGMNAVFMTIRRAARPSPDSAHAAILRRLSGQACRVQGRAILADGARHGWALAYALSWLAVAGGNSVMPPWVRHQFPDAGELVRQLRDSRCSDASCDWCADRHDAHRELQRWFGFPGFRPEPAGEDGRPLQQSIAAKFADIYQLVMTDLPPTRPGGAIVYCALRKQTEEVAQFLREKGLRAGHFHAGLAPETKKTTQQQFITGQLDVMVATNAFGMGIDKPDVRLVIHADLPGSLENYLQEAGRAGRDRAAARCILLYTPEDVERQFSMSARSRLTQREIQAILKALKNLNRKKRLDGDIIATAGEILAEDTDARFQRDSATDDTRVRTGIAWLEEASLLTREENRVQVFPSSLRVASVDEAQRKLAGKALFPDYQRQLLALVQALISADADEGISTDELMGVSGLSADKVRAALYDLEALGIASNDTALTAFVHAGVERASLKRLDEAAGLEIALIDVLRQAAPDLGKGEGTILHLRHVTQALKDAGHPTALP